MEACTFTICLATFRRLDEKLWKKKGKHCDVYVNLVDVRELRVTETLCLGTPLCHGRFREIGAEHMPHVITSQDTFPLAAMGVILQTLQKMFVLSFYALFYYGHVYRVVLPPNDNKGSQVKGMLNNEYTHLLL